MMVVAKRDPPLVAPRHRHLFRALVHLAFEGHGNVVGKVTSGAPSPSLGGSVGMGYVPPSLAAPGTPIKVIVRGRAQAAEVAPTPFHPHRYVRKV